MKSRVPLCFYLLSSSQRCIVLHATSRVNVFDNFAYESRGHCFIVEEGSETMNVFKRNLGINIRAGVLGMT